MCLSKPGCFFRYRGSEVWKVALECLERLGRGTRSSPSPGSPCTAQSQESLAQRQLYNSITCFLRPSFPAYTVSPAPTGAVIMSRVSERNKNRLASCVYAIILYYVILYRAVVPYSTLYYTALCFCDVVRYSRLYYIILYCTVLCNHGADCTTLYYYIQCYATI